MDGIGLRAREHLSNLPAIDPVALQDFASHGHVLVRGLLDADVVEAIRPALEAAIERSGRRAMAPHRGQNAYERAFIQLVNVGLEVPDVGLLTHSPRLGAWVAALLGATGARLLLEDTFLKLAGGGATPWHQDASVAPVAPDRELTAWIPMQRVTPEMGGLRLVRGSHRFGLVGPVDISEQTQQEFDAFIADNELEIVDLGVMEPGDVSFHAGCTIHGSRPNMSSQERLAIALHCFADGAAIAPNLHPGQAALLQRLAPGLAPGDLAAGPLWPRIFPGDPK